MDMKRDGKQGAGIYSGTSHKEKFWQAPTMAKAGPASCGMNSVGKNEKSAANPKNKVSRDHVIW